MDYFSDETFSREQYGGTLSHREYDSCTFEGCQFTDAVLQSVSFLNCRFVKCAFRTVEFAFSTMENSAFQESLLVGINWAELFQTGNRLFPLARMENCTLKFNNFLRINLARFDFSRSVLQDCYFHACRLGGAMFRDCDLSRTIFTDCDLRRCDFRGARGYRIALDSNQLKQARFSFPDVVDLLATLDIVIE